MTKKTFVEDMNKIVPTAVPSRLDGNKYPDGNEVAGWPEFIALAKRLGIMLDTPWTKVTIHLEEGSCVKITQEYLADDIDQQDKLTQFEKSRGVNTTSMHNVNYRTCSLKGLVLGANR